MPLAGALSHFTVKESISQRTSAQHGFFLPKHEYSPNSIWQRIIWPLKVGKHIREMEFLVSLVCFSFFLSYPVVVAAAAIATNTTTTIIISSLLVRRLPSRLLMCPIKEIKSSILSAISLYYWWQKAVSSCLLCRVGAIMYSPDLSFAICERILESLFAKATKAICKTFQILYFCATRNYPSTLSQCSRWAFR